jgi:hypothetical protein
MQTDKLIICKYVNVDNDDKVWDGNSDNADENKNSDKMA